MGFLRYIFIVSIVFFGFFMFGIMHEEVHKEIYRHDGIESHIEFFSHFPDLVTVAEEPCKTEVCSLSHNINDAVGYHLIVFYTIGACLIIIISAKSDYIKKGKIKW